jgi:exopolyphosphatase/guanosine-5'-triphosphate,3'-diphosphate pyrophosphatase
MPNIKKGTKGCIDLGSTYFRLLVAKGWFPGGRADRSPDDSGRRARHDVPSRRAGPPHAFEVVLEDKIYVGWGDAIAGDGQLPYESIEEAAAALRVLLSRARGAGCIEPLLLGTNTLRRARNRAAALRRLRDSAGLPLTVLSQEGEAALSYLGASTILGRPEPALLIDLGGTSTEIAWGRGGVMEGYRGIPWGTHVARTLLSRCSHRASFLAIRERLFADRRANGAPLYILPIEGKMPTILATGGTAVSLAVVLQYMRGEAPVLREQSAISADELDFVVRRLWPLYEAAREHRLPLERERVHLLLPGLILLTLLVRAMGMPGFIVTPRDLRWGGVMVGTEVAEYSTDRGRN